MEIRECPPGTDLCMALDLGAALSGGKMKSDKRLVWTTDNASIELVGTVVMIAYRRYGPDPGTDVTIVRVFDGTASITDTTGANDTVTARYVSSCVRQFVLEFSVQWRAAGSAGDRRHSWVSPQRTQRFIALRTV
jgi:hypothetical protein